jgi:hypothetical protein
MVVGSSTFSLFVAKGNRCNNLPNTGSRKQSPDIQTVSSVYIANIICVVAGFEILKYKK